MMGWGDSGCFFGGPGGGTLGRVCVQGIDDDEMPIQNRTGMTYSFLLRKERERGSVELKPRHDMT
jgi:hypothetical protein